MSEVLPEPYFYGNVRATVTEDISKIRPKTVPASLKEKTDSTSLFRPISGCRRLDEVTDTLQSIRKKLPVTHRLQRRKEKAPPSPMEIISEKPGLKVMKSKTGFLAEVDFQNKSEGKKVPTVSAVLRKEMDEDLELPSSGPVTEFKKIAQLQSEDDIVKIASLQRQLKIKEAEMAVKEKVIRQMQQQVDDFQLQLGEERLNHQDTRKAYEERLIDQREQYQADKELAIKTLTDEYDTKINDINVNHEEEIIELKNLHARVQKKLEDQIEHLENAFDEFRVSFTSEMELKWKRREEEMRKRIQEETDGRWQAVVNKQSEKHKEELEQLKKKQAEEIEVIRHEHESEINSLLRKYKDAYALSEKVMRQQQLIDGLHEKLREFETKLEDATLQLTDKTHEAAELTLKLTTMERDFSTKLQQNAEMWQRRMEGYISENADIKRLYAFSVHRQSSDRLERDIEIRERSRKAAQLANAKVEFQNQLFEAVVHSRLRSNLPLVPANVKTSDEERQVRRAQQLRQKAARLGAAAIVESNDLLKQFSDEKPAKDEDNEVKEAVDLYPSQAGRPMSAPTTDVENFLVFMAAAAAINPKEEGESDPKPSVKKRSASSTNRRSNFAKAK